MAYQAGSNKFGNKFSSNKSSTSAKQDTKKERAPITHIMVTAKDEEGNSKLVEGVFISENQYGLTVYLSEGVTLGSGRYFINKRKEKEAVNS